jgi:hypothetical protein
VPQFDYTAYQLMQYSFSDVMNWSPAAFFCLYALLTSWFVAPNQKLLRIALVFPLGFFLFFYSPYLAPVVSKQITSPWAYWRVFWILPLPLVLSLMLSCQLYAKNKGALVLYFLIPLAFMAFAIDWGAMRIADQFMMAERKNSFLSAIFLLGAASLSYWVHSAICIDGKIFSRARISLFVLTVLLFYIFLPFKQTLSARGGVRVKLPTLRVPQHYYLAKWIADHVPEDSLVLAPHEVAIWLSTFERRPASLLPRRSLDTPLGAIIGKVELRRRFDLHALVSARQSRIVDGKDCQEKEDFFVRALQHYKFSSVVLDLRSPCSAVVREALANISYRKAPTNWTYEVWLKADDF